MKFIIFAAWAVVFCVGIPCFVMASYLWRELQVLR